MGTLVRARIRISGVVQGVGYRYFVRNLAISMGVSGLVRNRPDGKVEVVAEGERQVIEALIAQLRLGPRYASVERLDIEWEEPKKDFTGFDYAF
jgi:acylphosphatase